jgi:hypothetical protein
MHSKNAFTLLEICLAITIGVLIFTFAIPSIEGFFAQQKLNKSFDAFDELVAEAHKLSVLERRSYLISWEKAGVMLRPEFPLNKDEAAGVAMIEARENESYDIELTAALVENPPREWVFWPSGNCEPARITYQGREGNWIARYDPLTARAAEVENETR